MIGVAMTANAMQGDREKCLAAGMDDYLAKPVRLEDIRKVVERWGAAAAKNTNVENEASVMNNAKTSTATEQTAASTSLPAAPAEAPVEMDRLLDFTEGNPDSLRELVTLYIDQTAGQIEQLEAAVQAGTVQEVRRLAHSCAGASATCGMRGLVPMLRELERQGYEEKLTNAAELCRDAAREFARIRDFLQTYLANLVPAPNLAVRP
jgi:CheY-like chemotaxis protein